MKKGTKNGTEEQSMIEAIRKFIIACPFLKEFEDAFPVVDVENLGEEVDSYSIETVPIKPVIKSYLDGSSVNQFAFVLASRELNSTETNIESSRFYEKFSNWMNQCSREEVFPDLGTKREVMKMEVTTCGYVFNSDETKAQYQIQCHVKYYQKV